MKTFTGYRRTPPKRGEVYDNATDRPQYEGVLFSDSRVVIRWLTAIRSISVWDSMADFIGVHGHIGEYNTELHWNDGTITYLDKSDG